MGEGTVYQGEDGTSYCAIVLQATAPAVNFTKMQFGYRRTGGDVFSIVEGTQSSGSLWKARIDGLVPGMSYDFVAISVNNNQAPYNAASCAPITLIAAGDVTAPATPTGLTGKDSKGKTWSWTWTKNAENDLKRYRVQVATSSAFTTIIYGADADKKYVGAESFDYTNDAQSYGTLYCRIQAVDFSGNASAWTSGVYATTSQSYTTDIATGGIATGNIANDQVTTPKRQSNESQSATLDLPADGSVQSIIFYHNLNKAVTPVPYYAVNDPLWGYDIIPWFEIGPDWNNKFVLNLRTSKGIRVQGTVFVDYW